MAKRRPLKAQASSRIKRQPRAQTLPHDTFERAAGALEGRTVFGVDEVGRGPLAGPVTAAACWLDLEKMTPDQRATIADSKALNEAARVAALEMCQPIAKLAIGWASVEEIDRLNILQASLLAMWRAVDGLVEDLGRAPDRVLVDGNRLPDWPYPADTVVKGDSVSLSIALASIAAKQARDAEMTRLAAVHPGYGWERNAGYGTAAHRQALIALGVTPHHRSSFSPVRALLDAQ